jgi:hypothetical protein
MAEKSGSVSCGDVVALLVMLVCCWLVCDAAVAMLDDEACRALADSPRAAEFGLRLEVCDAD